MAAGAQDKGTIRGTVTDGQTGESIPGANVVVTEVQQGAATNSDGEFSLKVAPGEYTVKASFVGYKTGTRSVTVSAGSTTRVRFALGVSQAKLDEVVVTGQQVDREARSLGYSVTSIGGAEVEQASEENLVKSLSGKVAGVDISSQSGNVGGGAQILLRGIASIGGDNQPLFVVDGVPISNSNVSVADDRLEGATDTGNKASQINPNNIESISVLKSGAAAALYGQRAKNGVVLIETKKGTEGRAGASFKSAMTFNRPTVLPNYQSSYGPGDGGKYDNEDLDGWGPRMSGQPVEIFTGETVPLRAADNPVQNFYDRGSTLENSVSFSNATESVDYRLGLTALNSSGIVPNSELDRYNLNFNSGTEALDDRLEARVTGNYIKEETLGRAVAGGNDPNVLVDLVNGIPRNLSASTLENNYTEGGDQISLTPNVNNPYWTVNKNQFQTDTERFYGSATISFDVTDWLTLQEKVGTDIISEERRQPTAAGTVGQPTGAFFDQVFREREIDHNFTVRADNEFGEDFSLKTILGHNVNQRSFEEVTNQATNLSIPGVQSYPNANSNTPENFFQKQRLIGAYGSATIGFREYAYLELTGRNDWSSTLPKENRSYFYPSASLSVIFTDLLQQEFDTDIPGLSYGKLRTNYAEVGSDTDPYQLEFRFFPVSDLFTQFVDDFTYPYQGIAAFERTGTFPPTNLKPQRQKSWEVGTELGFLDGRLSLDFTYYNQRTERQILDLPVPQSTGYFNRQTNAGTLLNEGVEADVRASVFTGEQFRWRINANYSRNRTTVEDLPGSLQQVALDAGFNDAEFRIEPGDRPIIYGPGLERTDSGKLIIDPEDGLPNEGDARDLGDLYPDFKAGISNTIGYGNFSLSFLIDWKQGGSVFSATVQDVRGAGLAEETEQAREGSFVIDEGVIVDRDAQGNIVSTRPNDVPVESMEAYWGALTSTVGPSVFDASYVKLRELSLRYSFPESWFDRTPLQNGSIRVQGRNLLLLYSNIPHIDPETNVFGSGGDVGQGYEFYTVPNVTSFGATLNFSF